tara:strand:+ start:3588 stop:4583 length:996 start_codon:yes stop_codon:yes gene_type:complete
VNERILITGGAGFIGLHLANHLLDSGYSLVLVDNYSRGVSDHDLSNILMNERVTFINCDLKHRESVLKIGDDFSVIFHLAAIVGVSNVSRDPIRVLTDNVEIMTNVIRLGRIQKNLRRLLFSSTSEVYAGTLEKVGIEIPTPESTFLALPDLERPRTSYMLSKIYGEAMCHHAGLPYTVFRPHNIYGPRMGMSHVIPQQLKKAHFSLDGQQIDIYSPEHTRCFCYIDDAVKMMRKMMENDTSNGKILNLGIENPELSIKEVVNECHKIVGRNLIPNYREETAGSPVRRAPDMSETVLITGHSENISINEGIARTYAWYKKNVFDTNNISAI